MNWYAVNTQPRREEVAELNLRRLGVETFFPRIREERVIRRRREVVTGPLFPGYLFARFDLATSFRAVNYARGVKQVVSFGAVPAPVDEEVLDAIKARLEDGFVRLSPPALRPGQAVRIEEGPLRGLDAVFERELTGRQRVVLLLRALAYDARVVVAAEQIAQL